MNSSSHSRNYPLLTIAFVFCICLIFYKESIAQSEERPSASKVTTPKLQWEELPSIPDKLGVAGPFVGVSGEALIVAGGANFPEPVWENGKQWHDDIFVTSNDYAWKTVGVLPRPVGYGANVSTTDGLICIGGNDSDKHFAECFKLKWKASEDSIEFEDLPPLPVPLAYGQACLIGDVIYVAGGQTTSSLSSAVRNFFKLDLDNLKSGWTTGSDWPGPPRAFNMTVAQNNGFDDCLYLIGGRYEKNGEVEFLDDCWEYNPKTDQWRQRASMPFPVTAGCGVAFSQSHILVLSGDDGKLFHQTDKLKDEHPGFPKRTLGYHCITDTWIPMGPCPANQVTTTAVKFDGAIVLPTGEVRPRVRSPKVWRVSVPTSRGHFGVLDYLCCSVTSPF